MKHETTSLNNFFITGKKDATGRAEEVQKQLKDLNETQRQEVDALLRSLSGNKKEAIELLRTKVRADDIVTQAARIILAGYFTAQIDSSLHLLAGGITKISIDHYDNPKPTPDEIQARLKPAEDELKNLGLNTEVVHTEHWVWSEIHNNYKLAMKNIPKPEEIPDLLDRLTAVALDRLKEAEKIGENHAVVGESTSRLAQKDKNKIEDEVNLAFYGDFSGLVKGPQL